MGFFAMLVILLCTLNSIQCFLEKRFSWPGLFRTWFIFSDWFLHVSFSRFQYSKVHFGSLLHCFIKLSFSIGYSFAKDFCPCLLLFICKGLLSILGFCYMFTKDRVLVYLFIYKGRCPYFPFYLQRTAVLVFCYSFAKDYSPCVAVFILKGRCPCLVLFICEGCCPCLRLFICKGQDCILVFMLFICKGPWYLFCVEKTAVPVVYLLSPQDKMDHSPGKAWGAAYPSGLVKTTVSQISTLRLWSQ